MNLKWPFLTQEVPHFSGTVWHTSLGQALCVSKHTESLSQANGIPYLTKMNSTALHCTALHCTALVIFTQYQPGCKTLILPLGTEILLPSYWVKSQSIILDWQFTQQLDKRFLATTRWLVSIILDTIQLAMASSRVGSTFGQYIHNFKNSYQTWGIIISMFLKYLFKTFDNTTLS